MATTIAGHVSEYILGQDESKSDEIARAILDKKLRLVDVIECLGEYLTSPNLPPRKRGTQLLAEIMQKLPIDILTEKEVGHITTFLLSRLGDHHSIQPFALHGLASVISFSSFPGGEICRQICSDIFREIQNQSLSQGDRRATYTIFLTLLSSYLTDLQPMGDNFVCGYIQQMDGEKDPRNLLLAFRCALLICRHFSLGAMVEEMFEVTSCYFPVDFVPPPNDPHGIKREDLSRALREVMSCTPSFAQYCYPLLLEKLTSDVQSAKLDALNTLQACIPVYKSSHLQEYLGSLSTQIIREVRRNSSDDVTNASLQALESIVSQVSEEPKELEAYMADTGQDLMHQLESENSAVSMAAMLVLRAIAHGSPYACILVAQHVIPNFCKSSHKWTKLEQHIAIIEEYISLLQLLTDSKTPHSDGSFLVDWWLKLQEFCDKLLINKDSQLQVLGMQGLSALLLSPTTVSVQTIDSVVEKMIGVAIQSESDILSQKSEECLSKIVTHHSHLVEEIISRLDAILCDSQSQYHHSQSSKTFDNSTSLLVSIVKDTTTADSVCKVLLRLLENIKPGIEDSLVPVSAQLSVVLGSRYISGKSLIVEILPRMLSFLKNDCHSWSHDKHQSHISVLTHLTRGLCSAVMQQNKEIYKEVAEQIYSLLTDSALYVEMGGGDASNCDPPIQTSWQSSRLVQLLLALIPCIDFQNESQLHKLMSLLPDVALEMSDVYTRLQACKCISALINRMPSGLDLENSLSSLVARITSNLQHPSPSDLKTSTAALTLLIWLAKAMVIRGHKSSTQLTAQLIDLLKDSNLGLLAAEGFSTILAPYPDVLCSAVNATVLPTFQQRFLLQNLPHLVSGFHSAPIGNRDSYQLAVAGMLSNVPQQVLISELPQIMPLLVSSLKGNNSHLHCQTLSTMTIGIKDTPSLLTSYLSDILPDCLQLAVSGATMRVRLHAVKCLGEMTHLPITTLQPYKSTVLNKLKLVLDDHKRLVRKEAVSAINTWCFSAYELKNFQRFEQTSNGPRVKFKHYAVDNLQCYYIVFFCLRRHHCVITMLFHAAFSILFNPDQKLENGGNVEGDMLPWKLQIIQLLRPFFVERLRLMGVIWTCEQIDLRTDCWNYLITS